MAINIAIKGGLGNQLFQYAFGKYLKNQYACEVFYDAYPLLQTEKDLTPRKLILTELFDEVLLTSKKTHELFHTSNNGIVTRAIKKLKRLLTDQLYIQEELTKEIKLNREKSYYLDGYWQNKIYSKFIVEELTNLSETHLANNKTNTLIKSYSDSVGIHVRRGDYITNVKANSYHGVCDVNYFTSALSLIEKSKQIDGIFVFSDDIDWAKQNIKHTKPIHYVNGDPDTPQTDLFLMKNCKHLILSNSSFSSWASYLNTYTDKIVVAPKQWTSAKLTEELPIRDDQWILI